MNEYDPMLKIRFDGADVGEGRIPVSHLLSFLDGFSKVLQRTARVLLGETDSVREGPVPRRIREEVEFDLVLLTHGSPATVIGLEQSRRNPSLPGMDLSSEILEKALGGLESAASGEADDALPPGYDRGVLMAWRSAGSILGRGVDEIQFSFNKRKVPLQASLTSPRLARIRKRIHGPEINVRSIEGRLLMADFRKDGTRCRVHPSVGDAVLCRFGEEQRNDVLENLLQYVRVTGEAEQDAESGKIKSIEIHDVERLADFPGETIGHVTSPIPATTSFWESRTIKELALLQNVGPVEDVGVIFGTWPGEEDDGFEEEIERLRHESADTG